MKLPKYDICVNAQGKLEGLLISLFSRAKVKISWNKKGWRIFYTNPVDTDRHMVITGVGNTVDGRLALLEPLNLKRYSRDLKILYQFKVKKCCKRK